jgi:sortase A
MKWLKKNMIEILLGLALLVGLCLILYPTVSNYWNRFHQSRAISTYTETVEEMDDSDSEKILEAAKEYNAERTKKQEGTNLSGKEMAEYKKQLNVSGLGIMGYIEIPKINCNMPIYHGTDESILQIAAGHLEWTSLPVGGKSSHCVIAGHSGLPSAKLFTDLDSLEIGDIFMITVLTETLTYEVDQIKVVLPEEVDDLKIVEGKDLCTLVTCTPYGINSHRLLVRGHRIANIEEDATGEAAPIQKLPILLAAGAMLLAIGAAVIIRRRTRKKRKKTEKITQKK